MPKINLPELQALAEYVTGKVPRLGMFSTLKGLIDNSPKEQATAQEWAGYLKPGQIATRAGVEFPLKKEELQYSGIPDFLAGVKPNEMIGRDQLLQTYMKNAPNLNVRIGSYEAGEGKTPEQLLAAREGFHLGNRLEPSGPTYSQYSHAERGDNPNDSYNALGDRLYQLSVTRGTPEQIGEFGSHFGNQDIAWSRTNRLPMDPYNREHLADHPEDYQGRLLRVIDEIQSDRHQKAIEKFQQELTPENRARGDELIRNLATAHDPQLLHSIFNEQLEPSRMTDPDAQAVYNDPDYQELVNIRKGSYRARGYQDKNTTAQIQSLQNELERLGEPPQRLQIGSEGNVYFDEDPDVARQIQNLNEKIRELNRGVPDTPFKTTQGFVGLEMRKALNDALQSGDSALGLATGNDQASFYGHRFDEDQTSGQNYNYNVSYPSVLKDIARRYGLPYGPQTVHLSVPRDPYSAKWPPPRMAANMMMHEGYEEPTLENFIKYSQDTDRIEPSNEPSLLSRMYHSLLEPFENEETEPSFGHNSEDVDDAVADMKTLRRKMDVVEFGHRGQPQAFQSDPEWQKLNQALNEHRATIHSGLSEVFNAYKEKFDPSLAVKPEDQFPGLKQKSFENAIDLSDPANVERIKQAGVPVWHSGGSVDEFDHVGHALHRLGYPTGGAVSNLGKLVEQLVARYHEFMTAPEEALTHEQVAHIHDLSNQIKALGHDPEEFLTQPEEMVEGAPNVVKHAEGGPVDDSSDLPSRAGYAVIKHFYGPDSEGHMVLMPGGSTLGLKELEGIPYRLSQLADMVAGSPPASAAPKGYTPDEIEQWRHQTLADSPPLAGSKAAAGEAENTEQQLRQQSGITPPHTFPQHLAENADAVVPIPGLKAEGSLSHLLGFLGGASPKNYPRMLSEWAGLNAALESLSEKLGAKKPQPEAKADGGQPQQLFDPDTVDTAPVESQEQNEMLMRRMFTHPQSSAPITLPQMQAAGGDIRRKPAILNNPFEVGKPPGVIPNFERPQTPTRPSGSSSVQQQSDIPADMLELLRARLFGGAHA